MKLKLTATLLIAVATLIAICAAQSFCVAPSCSLCPSIELNDRNSTEQVTYYNVRDYKYGEYLINCPGVPTGIWNTMAMNNLPGYPDNSIPDPILNNWSADATAKQYDATSVFANAPRHWTMDSQTFMASTVVRNLDGLFTRWGADIASEAGGLNYVPTNVTCNRTWNYDAGMPIFILDDPNGMVFVMQSYCTIVDKNLTLKDLTTIGKTLTLPTGWKYRTEVLTKPLAINGVTENGKANQWKVTQDTLQNTYSACWKSGNQSSCNYMP